MTSGQLEIVETHDNVEVEQVVQKMTSGQPETTETSKIVIIIEIAETSEVGDVYTPRVMLLISFLNLILSSAKIPN